VARARGKVACRRKKDQEWYQDDNDINNRGVGGISRSKDDDDYDGASSCLR